MQKILVDQKDANIKIEKYILGIFPNLSYSILMKTFRKRDIKVNGKRVDRDYIVKPGDMLEIYITDDLLNNTVKHQTLSGAVNSFSENEYTPANIKKESSDPAESPIHPNAPAFRQYIREDLADDMKTRVYTELQFGFKVVYEDDNLLIVNKAQGVPVHPDKEQTKNTLIDQVRIYLNIGKNRSGENRPPLGEPSLEENRPSLEEPSPEENRPSLQEPSPGENRPSLEEPSPGENRPSLEEPSPGENRPPMKEQFQPSLCHRLDRNTGGLVIIAKNKVSYETLLDKIQTREIRKYYKCIVKGRMERKEAQLNAYLWKDARKSRVFVSNQKSKGALSIVTSYKVLEYDPLKDVSMLEVELITGRTHQIRAHLAFIGHPIVGDGKYGINTINRTFKQKMQALWAYKICFNFTSRSSLDYLNGKVVAVDPDFSIKSL